ncbi:S-adenosyl-L-methionine-dependent methyltransferase [Xylariaceae sp. FL1019]|nr:S-adenosyl-L-methionine-dependent methyltransferase [Xylariaceae sp. FL1019]
MAEAGNPTDIKSRLRDSYNAIAPTYNKWTASHHAVRMTYLAKALAYLDPSQRSKDLAFLELGCGCGQPVTEKLFSYPNATVFANDISDTQLALVRDNLLREQSDGATRRLNLIPGDMNSLEFDAGSFDLVAAFYSVMHLPRDEQLELLERVARWLKPGGYLVANFAVEDKESEVIEKWLGDDGWMYWSGWGNEKNLQKIKDVGLDVVLSEETTAAVPASFLWVIAKR